jgi:hypothetical protein
LIAVFTGRASVVFIDRVLALGTNTTFPERRIWLFLALWLAVAVVVAGVCLWRARAGVRLLVALLAVHLAALTVAAGISSRQCVVPSVAAALLTVWGLRAGAKRLVNGPPSRAWSAISHGIPAAGVAFLILAAQADHRTAARVHLRVADLSRALVAQLQSIARSGERVELTLINFPGAVGEDGINAFAFANGLDELSHIMGPAVHNLELAWIPIRNAPPPLGDYVAHPSRVALRAELSDPHRVVLLYEDQPSAVRALAPADMEGLTAP